MRPTAAPPEARISETILEGAQNGSEMGVYCLAQVPLKRRGLAIKFEEYAPIGQLPVWIDVRLATTASTTGTASQHCTLKESPVGSDRARISFDRTREYRSLVAQQGRVTLEADVNEQAVISSEALRLETIDIIGPTGTPDDGYLVSINASGQITVGPGIMYVGGWRMRFHPGRPPSRISQSGISTKPWSGSSSGTKKPAGNAVIALLVSEQEIQAVEDQALLEVALGGPDTAARTRLMQHIITVPTKDDTCAAVPKDWNSLLKPLGLALNPDTFALDFNAALEVSFYPPAGPSDPCCPPAQGGYLGADNQFVRVTVTSYNTATHTGTLLWGWNNASFLYRAAFVDPTASPLVLTLSPAPVDYAHMPQLSQVIELLRSTMVLGNPADQNFIAAPQGDVIILASSGTVFDPTTNLLTLPTGTVLPTGYATDTNPLFVRLWQAEVSFTDGTSAQLDQVSGLAVTIHMDAFPTGPLEARPFWDFAVRPNTSAEGLPPTLSAEAPQGPTGSRRWLTDLALVESIRFGCWLRKSSPTAGSPSPPLATTAAAAASHSIPRRSPRVADCRLSSTRRPACWRQTLVPAARHPTYSEAPRGVYQRPFTGFSLSGCEARPCSPHDSILPTQRASAPAMITVTEDVKHYHPRASSFAMPLVSYAVPTPTLPCRRCRRPAVQRRPGDWHQPRKRGDRHHRRLPVPLS